MNNQITILLFGLLAATMILASGWLHSARLKMECEIERLKMEREIERAKWGGGRVMTETVNKLFGPDRAEYECTSALTNDGEVSEKERKNELLINDVESNNSEVISNRQEWISVDERLPKHGKNVLVYCDRHGIGYDVAYWNEYKKAWFSHYLSFGHNVTHWMPLPEPPMMKGGAE